MTNDELLTSWSPLPYLIPPQLSIQTFEAHPSTAQHGHREGCRRGLHPGLRGESLRRSSPEGVG